MEEKARVSFAVEAFEQTSAVPPVIDGLLLPQIITAFERDQHFEPAGGYGGLIPRSFNYGALDRYFLADLEKDSHFDRMGRVTFLGSQSGEVGCWPLLARICAGSESVVWDSFEQPYRKERDYSGFGPLVFDAKQYRQAVTALCTTKFQKCEMSRGWT
jgi:hypothetical protein